MRRRRERAISLTRKLISSGSTFEAQIGYSRAVVVGYWVFVSGTTGFDYSTMSIAEGLVEQTEQCLKNIESALHQAGSSLKDVVRVTYVLPNGSEFEQCWPVRRRYLGDVRPAAMMISAGLSFRSDWFNVIDRGELKGHVTFAQDILGNFYSFAPRDGAIHFICRSAPECAFLSTNFTAFLAELEKRNFRLDEWTVSLGAKPYEWGV